MIGEGDAPRRKEEARALFEKADRYLLSARLLLVDGDVDSCISRVYYSRFFSAEAALLADGVRVPGSHGGVSRLFGLHFITRGRLPPELGRTFTVAMEMRQAAEYHAGSTFDPSAAEQLLSDGHAFVQAVRAHVFGSKDES